MPILFRSASRCSAWTGALLVALVGCSNLPEMGTTRVYESATAVTNGLADVNGLSLKNGLSMNGLSMNGLSMNGLSMNGLSSTSGLMTTVDGRRTVSYLVKCALAQGDTLVKADQYGTSYTFAGGLGFAPAWKTGLCDQNCQELVSACLMAHVNTYGIHYPIWIDSAAPSVGWGLPASNYQMEGTFFGNILATGAMGHGSLAAPLGYYCDGTGLGTGVVAGRLGDVNVQGAAPYYNAYLGNTCQWSGKCAMHSGGDGFTSCTDAGGNTFNNLVTVWRDPNAVPTPDPNYVYALRSVIGSTGLALNVTGGAYSNGTEVQQWRYVGSNKLGITDSGAGNGSYKIFFQENPGKCLDNPGGQTANGTKLQVWDCLANDPWQQWMISVDVSTGAAYFKNVGSGKCMDDTGSTNPGVTPWIWDCANSNVNQKWLVSGGYWRPQGSSFQFHDGDAYVLLAGNGLANTAVDSRSNYANGAQLQLASATDNDVNDRLRILAGTSPNSWIIRFVGGGGSKCLDHPLTTTNGATMRIWDCNGGTNQNWIITNNPNGGVSLQNQYSGKCLDDAGAHGADIGASVVTWDCSTSTWFQMWQLTTY